MKIDTFLEDVREWGARQDNIVAVALAGSHARGEATEASDVDLVCIARDPKAYIKDRAWASTFGHVIREQVETYGRLTSVRVWYADGLEVEFGLTDEAWAAMPLDSGTQQVLDDGMRLLFERGGVLSKVVS